MSEIPERWGKMYERRVLCYERKIKIGSAPLF